MKDKLVELARKAKASTEAAATRAGELVQAHSPSPDELAEMKARAIEAGRAVGQGAMELGRELAESKVVKDGAKGAAVGAVVAVPLPIVGPVIGAVVGAGVGVYLGQKGGGQPSSPELQGPPVDLTEELRKLDAARKEGLLTDAEFEAQKRKLLRRT